MLQQRWYQQECVEAFFNYFMQCNGNPLFALPTGSGKGVIIALILKMIMEYYPNQRILCATHIKELISQNHKQLVRTWPHAPAGIYSAGLKRRDIYAPITFVGIASIVKIIEAFGHIDLFFIDEAHLLADDDDGMYMMVIAALKACNPYLKVVGFTATHWRNGMGLLTNGPIFTDIPYNLCTIEGFRRLFAEGYLVPPRAVKVSEEIDFSGVKLTGGEYSNAGMNAVTKNEIVTWKSLNEALARGHNRNCRLVFCTGVEHAILAAQMLKYIGLRAEAVHSKMSNGARDDIMTAFRNGEFDTLTNNGICTTGLDHPPIDHIIILRKTTRVGLWVQILGRGTRPFELNGWHKEDCLVSDHAGNARSLGTIDDPYIPKLKGKGHGDAPVKLCPACDSYNHASARVCAFCGEPFELKVGYKEKAFDDALVRSDLPIFEDYKVEHVYYTQYLKKNALPSDKTVLKAVYQCGMLRFQEVVAFEAPGYGRKRAEQWWKQRFPAEGFIPATVNEAMGFVDRLVPPTTIKVWVNKKYPEIVEYGY